MAELEKNEIQSPELQEVMSGIPGSFLRWGLFMFFGIISILIAGTWFIKYPDIVTVPVVITTQNPPVSLVAGSSGRIVRLFACEGNMISKDGLLAVIENGSDYEATESLKGFLAEIDQKQPWSDIVFSHELPEEFSVGEIQSDYSVFIKSWKTFREYLAQNYLPSKLSLLEKQIENKKRYYVDLLNQKNLLTEDLELAGRSYERDSILFHKERYSISVNEYDRSRQAYLQKLYSFSVFMASLKNNEADVIRMNETKLDLEAQYEREKKQMITDLEEKYVFLMASIAKWEETYLIKTPISGKVTMPTVRKKNQYIRQGEVFAIVIPDSSSHEIALAEIPVSESGKVTPGQQVTIKLTSFPYMQFGVLKGTITSISVYPGEKGFIAEISLPSGMLSAYGNKLKFLHEMSGTAEIITQDSRLISRFLNPLKSAFIN